MKVPELGVRIEEWRTAMAQTEHFSLDKTPPEKIFELWDAMADGFDSGLGQDIGRVIHTLEILTRIGALHEDTIAIDIGCGTGTFTLELAKHCRKVYAFDLSPKMLAALDRKAAEQGASNIVTICADWKAMDLSEFDPDISLALACLNTGLYDFEGLDKMNRVSKGWCCYMTSAGLKQAPNKNELQEIVFGRTLKSANGNDIIFPFNVIYTMGYSPELHYVPCSWSDSSSKEEAIDDLVENYSRYKDIDSDTKRRIEAYVDSQLDEFGRYPRSVNTTLGVMTWNTAQEL